MFPRDLPNTHQNLPHTWSTACYFRSIDMWDAHNHSQNVSKPYYHVLCLNDYISDRESLSFIPRKRIWVKKPNYASSLENTGSLGISSLLFPLIEGHYGVVALTLDAKLEKVFPLLLIWVLSPMTCWKLEVYDKN